MKTEIKIPVRGYQVTLKDTRTGEVMEDTIVLEKSRLQAGALFELGDEDIIYRIYNRKGYRVLDISKPRKVELSIDLEELYTAQLRQIRMDQLLAFGKAHSDAQPNNQEAEACD